MVKFFYHHTQRTESAFRKDLSEAIRFARGMQDEGRIVIEEHQIHTKTGEKGWRILEPYGEIVNAYLTAAWLWDKYGTHQGKIIAPTRPVERRNSENVLVDKNDKPFVNPHGKKITNLYDPHAVKQSEREPNPDAIKRYPVLSDEDLIYACFPNTNDTQRKRLLKRAQTHWTELEKAGIVRVERLTHGWRILPGASHVEKYRGVKETQRRK